MKKTALYLAVAFSLQTAAQAQLIISDNFDGPGAGTTTGFALDSGVNTDIDPPNSTTRLTGSAATDLRYINRTPSGKPDSSFRLNNDSHLRVNSGAQAGRTSLSADGTTAFDFGSALGASLASSSSLLEYDITISMDNNAAGTHRMSFGWGTVEGDATVWDFGLQLYKAVGTDTTYTVGKRFNTASVGVASVNAPIGGIANTAGSQVDFLIRVTDAGAEGGSDYNSRVRVSLDGGSSWLYDTDADTTALPNGFRFDGAGRFFSFDVAGGNSSFVLYDNFSINVITPVPEPSTYALVGVAGAAALWMRRRRSVRR